MDNAARPTKRTKHMDMRHFVIQTWVKQDFIRLKCIHTCDNSSDSLTKNTPRILFNRHFDFILGRTIPNYASVKNTISKTSVQRNGAVNTGW